LANGGLRVVAADLPGHGDSPTANRYTVGTAARALVELITSLDAGPAVVVATSFAPAAAVWAAAEHPGAVAGIVAISPHLEADTSLKGGIQRLAIATMLRGPWAARLWAKLYRGWFKESAPADLDQELAHLRQMLADPARRRAVRQTLIADREGVAERIGRLEVPTLTVMGSADDHFPDAEKEGRRLATRLRGELLVVPGAGHYPHLEQPQMVAAAIRRLVEAVH
jgi:pimeloyl-ACP methyl ester carboxylesterase